jgi:hypothetical protein
MSADIVEDKLVQHFSDDERMISFYSTNGLDGMADVFERAAAWFRRYRGEAENVQGAILIRGVNNRASTTTILQVML